MFMSVAFRQQIGLGKPTGAIRHATNCLRRAISPCSYVEGEKSRKKIRNRTQSVSPLLIDVLHFSLKDSATPEAIIQTKILLPNGVGLFG